MYLQPGPEEMKLKKVLRLETKIRMRFTTKIYVIHIMAIYKNTLWQKFIYILQHIVHAKVLGLFSHKMLENWPRMITHDSDLHLNHHFESILLGCGLYSISNTVVSREFQYRNSQKSAL